ncbi:hypothetical protein Goklo_012599, partial [Gossypium klotzschianum]|nr:hypothetical protein [Gossypium klotzschianum]
MSRWQSSDKQCSPLPIYENSSCRIMASTRRSISNRDV